MEDGTRLACLLNPASVLMRRTAGIQQRQSVSGFLTSAQAADDRILATGGGCTELVLELLFDVAIAGSTIETEDVRELSGPFWRLAENRKSGANVHARPPLVRFVWGRSWNVPGYVSAVAERLEYFSESGAPRRSFLKMRLLRASDETDVEAVRPGLSSTELDSMPELTPASGAPVENVVVHTVPGGGANEEGQRGSSERLDVIAHEMYGNPGMWRLIAYYNGITDPLADLGGRTISLPPLSILRGNA
jgi:hypothetical protein